MQTVKQLLSALNEGNFDYYEIASSINEEASIQLVDFKQLCCFMKKHNINTVFYHLEYICAEDLQITEGVLDDLHIDDEIIDVMREEFNQYNRAVGNLDYSRPYLLAVSCLYQGNTVYILESDYWFEEWGYRNPKAAAISMIKEKLDDIECKKEEAFLKREELRNQLRKRILADANFHKCTNKGFRRAYLQTLWKDKSIQKLFYSPKDGFYDIRIETFIEDIWREYKSSLSE